MNKLLPLIAIAATVTTGTTAHGQQNAGPAKWTYESRKAGNGEYKLVFHLSLDKGWHIWSLNPGGDGFQIIPSFTIDRSTTITQKGKVVEQGKTTTTTMEGIDGKVTYLSGNVDYIMTVVAKQPGKVTGKHTFQICDDRQCLAPTDLNFSFDLK